MKPFKVFSNNDYFSCYQKLQVDVGHIRILTDSFHTYIIYFSGKYFSSDRLDANTYQCYTNKVRSNIGSSIKVIMTYCMAGGTTQIR